MKTDILLDLLFVSKSGKIITDAGKIAGTDLDNYKADRTIIADGCVQLTSMGFQLVGPPSDFGVTIKGPVELVNSIFGPPPYAVPSNLCKWIQRVESPKSAEYLGLNRAAFLL